MGTTVPTALLCARIRQGVSLEEILRLYHVRLFECGEDENRMQCPCPLPSHPKKTRRKGKRKTFRIYRNGAHFLYWKCFSKTCAAGRAHEGDDIIALVALMEGCDLAMATEKLVRWFDIKVGE